jgi:hypothetical protein
MASLSITEGTDGKTFLHCFRGCMVEEILQAKGLRMGDLFAESNWKPSPPKPDWITKDGPVWYESQEEAVRWALICATLLSFPEQERAPLVGIWDKAKGPIPDPDALISGRWEYRPPDDYVVHPYVRNSVLQGHLKRAIISWYRLGYIYRCNGETQRIIAEYGFDELWNCLPERTP